jgi:RNA polymerase subunit RPABC4/transcription elongation factor Spt4
VATRSRDDVHGLHCNADLPREESVVGFTDLGKIYARGSSMVLFLSWIICAVLVGVYAGAKGRSGLGFFIVSLLLSPLIGFLIVVVSAPDRTVVAQRTGLKKCSECAEYVQPDARVCRFCGRKFVKKCSQCSEYMPEDARFCRSCGSRFSNESHGRTSPQTAPTG